MTKRKPKSRKSKINIEHIVVGVFAAILLLAFVSAQTVYHTAEETKIVIDGQEKTLQEAAEAGELARVDVGGTLKTIQKAYDDGDFADTAKITIGGVEKPLQQAWDDGDFLQDLPPGLASIRDGTGWYTCQSESCIATCLGTKVSLTQGQSRYCGQQTASGWSNYNPVPASITRIHVYFGVNGWNVDNCAGCSVGSYITEKSNGWTYCAPGVAYCPTNYYSGNWDRVTGTVQCSASGTWCTTGAQQYAKGWVYTPAISQLTPAAWTTTELSFPQPPVPTLHVAQYTKSYAYSYSPLYCPAGQTKVDCRHTYSYGSVTGVTNGCYASNYQYYDIEITCAYIG